MIRTITTLDNSKYKKDYNKYFTIGDHYGDSHKIGNTELSDETFEKVFNIIDTIVVIFPNEKGRIDGELAHKIKEESGDFHDKIDRLLQDEKLTIHSTELHKSEKADCKSAIRFFKFESYSEIDNFLRWEEFGEKETIRAYTTLISDNPVTNVVSELETVKSKDKTGDQPQNVNAQVHVPRIFKLSIGPGVLDHRVYQSLIDENLVTVHNSTKSLGWSNESQFTQFSTAKKGDFFYLCRGNRGVILVGVFTDDIVFYSTKKGLEGWALRRFRMITRSITDDPYSGVQKWWTPNHNSTFSEIPAVDYGKANELIFAPFFDTIIQEIFEFSGTPLISVDSLFNAQTFTISNEVDGVIGVDHQASEMVEILKSLKDDEPGKMVGIFGRWGRGKSFLWEQIKKKLENDKSNQFEFVEFHAWKFQDTPASWAYLYEEIVKVCIEKSDNVKLFGIVPIPWLKRNIWKYNKTKIGIWPIVVFITSLIGSIAWYVFIPSSYKLTLLTWIIGGGIGVSILLYKFYSHFLPKAKDLFKKYSKISSFKNLLGFQKEIQDELKLVLESTFGRDDKRILLFVDDIDRCSEDRIISVIDSLKVMLEDKEIAKKILVLTAVDERILKRAIEVKYHNSVSKSLVDEKDSRKIMIQLVREYLDKLFIAGIKLTELNSSERTEILDAFTTKKSKVKIERNEEESDEQKGNDEISNKDIELLEPTPTRRKRVTLDKNVEPFEIFQYEYSNLVDVLQTYHSATPRTIRIFYFRYLLAKRLLRYRILELPELETFLSNSDTNKIMMLLILQYSSEKEVEEIPKDALLINGSNSPKVKWKIFDTSYDFDRVILEEIFKVIEMVVAY